MSTKSKSSQNSKRRVYTDQFKRDAVQMLLDGHSASSIVKRLGISGTNLLYRWKKQQIKQAGPVTEKLDDEVSQLREQLRRVERERDILKKALSIVGQIE